MGRLGCIVLLAVTVCALSPCASEADSASNQLIVGFKTASSGSEQNSIIRRARGNRVKRFAAIRSQVIRPRTGVGLNLLRRLLLRNPSVSYVERDAIAQAFKAPNDPLFATQYAVNGSINTAAADAWNVRTSCSKVAVLDTGVDTDHPDLRGNIYGNSKEKANNGKDDDKNGYVDDYYGVNLVKGKGDGEDDNGHGTHVAGIIAGHGNNGTGVSGVCWSAKVIPVKFMNALGRGSTSDAIEGLEYAIKRGARIVNASFGSSSKSQSLEDEIERAKEEDVLIVAAAGNDGKDIDKEKTYPASYSDGNLLVVAASTSTEGLASFSNYGRTNVDLAAPGEGILSTYVGGGYKSLDGTSMAAPMVAGLAAMVQAKNSDASYSKIRSAIRDSIDKLPAFSGKTYSGGRVNLARALGKL
jgi:thermitase